jgi:hypothetical protein
MASNHSTTVNPSQNFYETTSSLDDRDESMDSFKTDDRSSKGM